MKKVDEMLKDLSIKGFEVSDCVKAVGNEDTESWASWRKPGWKKAWATPYIYIGGGGCHGIQPAFADDI